MAWTRDAPWIVRYDDVVYTKFALSEIPISAANFLLLMGESVERAVPYSKSADWRRIKAAIRTARAFAMTPGQKVVRAQLILENERRARDAEVANTRILAAATATPDDKGENRLAGLTGQRSPRPLAPRLDESYAEYIARANAIEAGQTIQVRRPQRYKKPAPQPKPLTLVPLPSTRGYFAD